MNTLATEAAQQDRVGGLIELATDTPELVVDLDVVRANVERIAAQARVAGVSLRPHTKTHKLPQIARMQLEAGAAGVQVAKLGEAEVMVDAGVDEVLVGYPIVGELKLARLADLAERAAITVTVDSEEVALGLSRTARERGISFRALLELDTGMRRLGVLPENAVELAERVAGLDGIELAGVFTHEGHVYVQARDDAERERMTLECCAAAVATAEAIRERGIAADVVSVGSAGTFRFAIRAPDVTEGSAQGTYVFNDRSQIAQGACGPADLAAFAVATVVARPAPDRVVVDAGSKVLTSDRMLVADPPASFGAIWGHDDWDVVRLSEEHGVVAVPPDADVRVGKRVAIVPNHVCPAINLANAVTVVEGSRVAGRWPVTARGLVQ